MDKHHKIRCLVSKLSGKQRDKAVMQMLLNPEIIRDKFARRLWLIRHGKDPKP